MDYKERERLRGQRIGQVKMLMTTDGYEPSKRGVIPGDCMSDGNYMVKGKVYVCLEKETGLLSEDSENFCGMRIAVPRHLEIPDALTSLFGTTECGSGKYLSRRFPYAETHMGRGYTYILYLQDAKRAKRMVDKEVEFTASLLVKLLTHNRREGRSQVSG